MVGGPGQAASQVAGALAAGERALHTDGDLPASRASFERAYRLAEQAGQAESMAMAALGLAGLWVSERRTVTGAVMLEERLAHAHAMLDPASPLALRLRIRLAAEADYRDGGRDRILAMLAEARAAGDATALAEALSMAHHCLLGPDDLTLRRDLAVELVKVSFRTRRRSDQLMGLLWQTVDSYAAGDPHAGRHLGELRDQLGSQDHAAVGFVVSAMEVMLAIRAGQLDEAESLVTICAKNGLTAGDIDSEWWPGAQLVTIRWYQGRLSELLPMLRERIHSPALSAVDNSPVAALAVAAAHSGDRRTAASCLAMLRGRDLAGLPRSSSWLVTMNGIVEAAHLLGETSLAARAYELLLPYAHLPMVGGLGITCFGSVHHALGVASLTLGRLDPRQLGRAIDHGRAAVEHNLALAHWPAVASSRGRLAEMYQLRGQQGDAEAAERERRAAASEAAALGPALAGSGAAKCERVGRNWRITLRDRSVLLPDSVGMLHLAVLVASPREDIAAVDLVAGLAALAGATSRRRTAQPVLDDEAIGKYRGRLRQLDAEIDGLESGESAADLAQLARARTDREWLLAQLASATGLHGRRRAFPDEAERARVSVGKAIRRALARINEADAVIGSHLSQSVHTGISCSYWPT
ncbi:MAG TPA: hypothetical protein VFQ44_00605 [Streptosporangiaceae bacterium]|nr:hypothetical protein [Streptosporangiaceae bacterium]